MLWMFLIVMLVFLIMLVCGALVYAASEAERITEEINEFIYKRDEE